MSAAATPSATSASDLVDLSVACRNRHDLDGADVAVSRALKLAPANFKALMIAASVALRRGDIEAAISYHRRLAVLAPDAPRLALEVVRLLVLSGDVKEGADELERALERWPGHAGLRGFALISGFKSLQQIGPMPDDSRGVDRRVREQQVRSLTAAAPRDAELLRSVVTDDKTSDVIVAGGPDAETCVLVFTGLNDVVSMPLPIFDRYLAAFGVAAIYLKDFHRLTYLKGVRSLGDDYASTVASLRDLCRRLGARRLCTLGFSAGGSAAVRYGIELDAARLVSLCGTSYNFENDTLRLQQGYLMMKERAATRLSRDSFDLRKFLLDRHYSAAIEWIYPEHEPRDKAHACYLAGISGVTLHSVPGCDDHYLLRWLALHDDLRAALAKYLGLKPPA